MRPLLPILAALGYACCVTAFVQSPLQQVKLSNRLSNVRICQSSSRTGVKMSLSHENVDRRSAVGTASAAALGFLANGLVIDEARAESSEIAIMKTTAGEMVMLCFLCHSPTSFLS
jgi:hypothetical protein